MDIIGSCDSGHFFYITATSDSSRLTHEVSGHLCHPNGFLYTINKCSLDLEKFGEKGPIPDHFSLRFNANRHEYHNIIHLLPQHYEIFTGSPWRHQSTVYPCHSTTNARKGRVLLTTTYTYHGHCPLDAQVSTPYFAPPNRSLTSAEHEKVVLLFNEEACQFDELVGGKGSSLALMSCNSSKMPIDCTVPSGFCLTVNAWKRQVDGNEGVLLKLKELEDVGKGLIQGQLENSCKEASALLASAPVDSYIQDCLREALQVTTFRVNNRFAFCFQIIIIGCFRNYSEMKLKRSSLPFGRQPLEKMEKIFRLRVRTRPSSAVEDTTPLSRASRNVGRRC